MGISINGRDTADTQRDQIIKELGKLQRYPWLPSIITGVMVGVIVALFCYYFLDDIRDARSIQQRVTEEKDKTITDVSVKTSGPLSFGGRPVYIYTNGPIHDIIIPEDMMGKLLVVQSDAAPYTATVWQLKKLDSMHFQIEASGVSTVSGSPSIIKFK